MTLFTTILAFVCVAASTAVSTNVKHGCTAREYRLTATAMNHILKGDPREALSSFDNFIGFLSQSNSLRETTGTYVLRGTYCPPTVRHKKHDAPLLLFVPGITYTRTYWSSLDTPSVHPGRPVPEYSWVDYASKRGYHTIAIDRLGTGESDHADWRTVVQHPFEAALLTSLAKQLRSHHDHIVWVGHSAGSQLATPAATMDPAAFDAYILTGIAQPGPNDNSALALYYNAHFEVASDFDSTRFPPDVYTDGYFVTANKTGRQEAFYSRPGIDYDERLIKKDFDTMTVVSLGGDFVSTAAAVNYTGPVFAMAGHQDAAFCGNGTVTQGDCGGSPNKVQRYLDATFPRASRKESYLQPRSGHDMLLHYTWKEGVKRAHRFLDGL